MGAAILVPPVSFLSIWVLGCYEGNRKGAKVKGGKGMRTGMRREGKMGRALPPNHSPRTAPECKFQRKTF